MHASWTAGTARIAGAFAASSALADTALAHVTGGTGAAGHWHASDVLGFAVVTGLAALAVWLDRRSR
jgi:uncharacterized membrane protein